jgi:uroporphyrinogen decarboxylase
MRQAGRYLPEYRELRKSCSMIEAVTSPEIAAEVTLLPFKRFAFDAAILFSDLTVPFTAMGAPFEIKENVGPVLANPIRSEEAIKGLRAIDVEADLGYVLDTIKLLKKTLNVPLIGFTGAPFTWACYMVEGGPSKDHKLVRRLMYSEPALFNKLMELLSENVGRFLSAQFEAGADAVQLFDSWVGVLSPEAYETHVAPHMMRIFERLAQYDKPTIHFGTGTAALLPQMQDAGGSVIGVDWRISLTAAAKSLRGEGQTVLQGNLDPALLLAGGPELAKRTGEILAEGRQLDGHIFNLGHGIYPETPLDHVSQLLDVVCGAAVAP